MLGRRGRAWTRAAVSGSLGAQFLLWEYATAVAGKILGINPFDQPNVAESKDEHREDPGRGRRRAAARGHPPLWSRAPSRCTATWRLGSRHRPSPACWPALLRPGRPTGYLAVMAYLDRHGDADAAGLRAALAGGSAAGR